MVINTVQGYVAHTAESFHVIQAADLIGDGTMFGKPQYAVYFIRPNEK